MVTTAGEVLALEPISSKPNSSKRGRSHPDKSSSSAKRRSQGTRLTAV